MDPKLQEQLNELEVKVTQIHEFTKKTERYMRFTFWVTIGVIVLPILAALFIIPPLVSSVTSSLDGLLTL